MSTPNSRRPNRGNPQTPTTPSSTPSPLLRTNSITVEPKSEFLRHALDARRARQATPTSPAPTPPETKLPQSATLNKAPSDPWLDQAKGEEDAPKVTPMRRPRRPSEGAVPRMKTQRELQTESEQLKQTLFNLNMKLELIRKQNNDLKDDLEEAQKRIEELEPFEDENFELREENDRLKLKLQDVTDDLVELRDQNAEILHIQAEGVANMEKQQTGLEEAVGIILQLQEENATLAQENSQLKDQVATLQTAPTAEAYNAGIDGCAKERCPSRVYSIDESRPSTSHFDSDYYSQPASPQVRPSKESLPSVNYSARAKNFLATSREGKKSVQDLKKRMSDASMKGLKPKASIPEVPQIPEAYQQNEATQAPNHTPRRSKPMHTLSPALAVDPYSAVNSNGVPKTPTGQADGLRGMFRETMTLDTSARSTRPSASYPNSPLETRDRRPARETSHPDPPARYSSRQAQTSSSAEQLRADAQSEANTETQADASEWASLPPPPSVVSEDLTTDLDSDCRDRWWKNVARLHNNTGRERGYYPSSGTNGARMTSGGHGAPYMPEQNFLFNPTEDENQFMKKAHGYMPKRRDR